MKKKIVSLVLIVGLCAAPLYGIDPVAAAQRAQMIVNQVLQRLNERMQIANQVTQIKQFTDQLARTREQIIHMKEAALGQIGALEESFAEMVAGPTDLVVEGMQWQAEFTGSARELVAAARKLASGQPLRESWRKILNQYRTNRKDIVELLSHLDPQVAARVSDHYLHEQDRADNRRVTTYLVDDSATALIETAVSAQESLQKLRSNSNVSDTALAQAQVTGLATQGELLSAMAQLMAFEAAREPLEITRTNLSGGSNGSIGSNGKKRGRRCLKSSRRTSPPAPMDCGKAWSTGFRPPLAVHGKPPVPCNSVRHNRSIPMFQR